MLHARCALPLTTTLFCRGWTVHGQAAFEKRLIVHSTHPTLSRRPRSFLSHPSRLGGPLSVNLT